MPVIFEITDLDYQNQTWIKADHVKHLITVFDFENSPKSIIVLIKSPIYYSFEFEITNGICQNNCTTWKINSQRKIEVWIESSKFEPIISSDGEASNFNVTIIFKWIILYFIIVGLIISLIFVIIWIKRRLLQQILSHLQPSELNDVNPVILTNEVTGIELNIDPLKDFTKTSFKSNSFVKNQEANKQQEIQKIASEVQS